MSYVNECMCTCMCMVMCMCVLPCMQVCLHSWVPAPWANKAVAELGISIVGDETSEDISPTMWAGSVKAVHRLYHYSYNFSQGCGLSCTFLKTESLWKRDLFKGKNLLSMSKEDKKHFARVAFHPGVSIPHNDTLYHRRLSKNQTVWVDAQANSVFAGQICSHFTQTS